MAGPTALDCAMRLLRDFGVTSLDPATPANQAYPIEDGDLDDIAGTMTEALQLIWDMGPSEMKEQPGSCYLHAPTQVTLTATQGSTVISGISGFQSWMLGCTIRINGDDQDNQLENQTTIGVAYAGTSGSGIGATVYGDCVQLDETVQNVIAPLCLPNQLPLIPADTYGDFIRIGGWPLVTGPDGSTVGYPFFWFVRKIIARPITWFVQGYYDPTLDYLPRRIRFNPMPDQAYSASYVKGLVPIRISVSDIDPDPGTKIPIPNQWHERVFLPICRQILSGKPKFKNSGCMPEINRAYRMAIQALEDSMAQSALSYSVYA